jgi:hypothetical protein
VNGHVGSVAGGRAGRQIRDESRPRLYDLCPAALDRLDVFRREWIGIGEQPELIGAKHWPGALDVDKSGLLEAAEEVAQCVQSELHALASPLRLDDAVELWTARRWYLQALIFLESNRLAKAVETRVSPKRQPLANVSR